MPIYTKTGDKGETGLFGGKRVGKDSAVVEAVGSVDELNAQIGVAIDEIKSQKSKVKSASKKLKSLEMIQGDLLTIGSLIAGYEAKGLAARGEGLEKRVEEMEEEIDEMWGEMPKLANFILPRGQLHLARTVCRRAERALVRANSIRPVGGQNSKFLLMYLNRLSDYLFCLARWVNFKSGRREVVWKNSKTENF